MKTNDRLYGEIDFNEPVLEDILKTSNMERLRGVDMSGYFEVYFSGTKYSRFGHSLGVAWLLRRFGAPLEEQVSGLLHDVSHSAFSHTIDYAFSAANQMTQNYQDDIHEEFLKHSEIPALLGQYGFSLSDITDDTRHPLKERDLPDLCADRIDYILRGSIAFGVLSFAQAQAYLDALVVQDEHWVFHDFFVAREFAELFRQINHQYYSGLESALMFRTTGDWLAHSLKMGYVSLPELYATDQEVIEKINAHREKDVELQKLWRRMNRETGYRLDACEARQKTWCKSRMIDPLCLDGTEMKKISDIDPSWGEIVRVESQPKEYPIIFEDEA
jgi:HD superfamily phosphohydrolase